MFFGGEDDDDSFASSGGGSSKLASLFGVDKMSSGNTSLTYTAPTEPKRKKKEAESADNREGANTSVLHAVAVTAYKLIEGSFTSQGKLGAAIIGNHSESNYKLLLYVSKQQQVTYVDIKANFHFTIQPSNYGNFYDTSRQNWSLLFESAQQLAEFARQIAIARANSVAGSLDALVSQDMVLGDGGTVEHADSVEVKYTGWLWKAHGPGQVFDTNSSSEKLFRFRLGKGKVIKGWDEGILGMKKGSSRLLIVPPSLAYGAEGMSPKVPPGSTLVFEVDVVRVKLAKEKEPSSHTPQTPAGPQNDTESDTADGVKVRSKSISEQLEHQESPKTDKAKLISRMAKMGQPMLPGIVTANSESETETPQTVPCTSPCVSPKPVLAAKPVFSTSAHSSVSGAHPTMTAAHPAAPVLQHPMMAHIQPEQVSQMALYQPLSLPQPGYPAGVMPGGVSYLPPTPMYPPQPYSGVSSEVNVMMSECRQQNTEVRLTVGHISDKIDRLAEKIDRLDKGSNTAVAMMGALPNMETDILLHNLQRIIQENDRLKKDLAEKTVKTETQNDKISELLERNQRLMEQNNTFLEKNSSTFQASASQSQARIQGLEQEKAQLAAQLSTSTAQAGALQTTVTSLKARESELGQQVTAMQDTERKHRKDFEDVSLRLTETEKVLAGIRPAAYREKETQQDGLQEELSQVKSVNAGLDKKLTDLTRKFTEERKELEDEMDKLKTKHEKEVKSLKEEVKKQKTPSDSYNAQQVSLAEKKLTREWQEKCDELVSSVSKKYESELAAGQQERQTLETRLQAAEKKYATLRTRAGEMKDHYEDMLAQEAGGKGTDSQDVVSEVKKIMNSVYQTLRTKFASDKSYTGTDIHSTILHAIKTVTLQLVEGQTQQGGEEVLSDEEDQDEGDEDGDEEGDKEGGDKRGYAGDELKETKEEERAITENLSNENSDRMTEEEAEGLSLDTCDNKSTRSDSDTHNTATPGSHITNGADENEESTHEEGTIEQSAATYIVSATERSERENQETMEERIEAMMSSETSQKPVTSKTLEGQIKGMMSHDVKEKTPLEDRIEAMMCEGSTEKKRAHPAEVTVRAVAASVTGGGGGNPHYAAQLEGVGKTSTEDVIQQVVAPYTGDRGNPHYAKELAASQPQKVIEPVISGQVTSQLAGKCPGKDKIKPVSAKPRGGAGSTPDYLSQLGVEGVEEKVHREVEPVVTATVATSHTRKRPGKGDIEAVVAVVTGGGGGNPHYAAELKKGSRDQSKVVGEVIKPVVAMTTGDKGNRHYAAELAGSRQPDTKVRGADRTDARQSPVKGEENKDFSKHSASMMASDKMDAIFAGIEDAMEDVSKKTGKKSKDAATEAKVKEESILAATGALFSDPFFDSSPQTVTVQEPKKTKGKSQTNKRVGGGEEDLVARLGILTTGESKTKAPKEAKSSSGNTNSDDDLKPRPPPQPLFADDDDDELDWLS